MSKADKMLFEQGFKKTEIKESWQEEARARYEEDFGGSITFGYKSTTLHIKSISYINIDLWLALNEKMKELGWIE